MKPLVVLDADGILLDFVQSVLDFVEDKTGARPLRESIITHNIWASIKDPELEKAFNEQVKKPGFCTAIKPYPEALAGFPKLAEIAEVHIATSPWVGSTTWMGERAMALSEHFNIHPLYVHHEQAKYMTRGDYFIDDHPRHVREWLMYRRDHYLGHGLLWDTPHNRLEDQHLWRIRSWGELTAIVAGTKVSSR